MNKIYKLGFVGGGIGSIAGYPHFIASQLDNRFKVIAGVFSNNDQTNHDSADLRHVKSYSTCAEMINNESLDAVVILTPTPLHSEAISLLLKNDIPIICEKPLVSSLEDGKAILNNLEDKFLVVTNNYSGYPMVRELKAKIHNGDLGEILSIDLNMPQETFLRPPKSIKYPQKWRLKDDYIPMICLDLGVHLHHLMYFLLEKSPSSIIANFNSFSDYSVIDDVRLWMKFQDSLTASMWMSKTALGHRNGLSINAHGTLGSASWVQEIPENLHLAFSDGKKICVDRASNCLIGNDSRYSRMTSGHPAGFIEAFANLYSDIADSLDKFKNGESYESPYVFGVEHALNGLELFHKARLSHEESTWQQL